MFDPQPHLIQLPRKVKDKATATTRPCTMTISKSNGGCAGFRDRYPHGVITTEEVCVDLDRGYARYKATVEDGQGGARHRLRTEMAADFATTASGPRRGRSARLAALGIGTQFVGQDLTEGDHIVDARWSRQWPHRDGTAGPTPDRPVHQRRCPRTWDRCPNPDHHPTDAGLPCAGVAIVDLKPASLSMLINKRRRMLQDGGDRGCRCCTPCRPNGRAGWTAAASIRRCRRARPMAPSGGSTWYCELCQVTVWVAHQPKRLRHVVCRKS